MLALVHNDVDKATHLQRDRPIPTPQPGEALIKVLVAGVCSTDLEITRGYVPGYHGTLGHEFVGRVERCRSAPLWDGARVVGEININCAAYSCGDAIFQRNHAPGRVVLGIIAKDGALAQYLTLPAANLHRVPASIPDAVAAFAEPLAAACRVVEQGLLEGRDRVAVLGDGKLGLLVAQVLALRAPGRVTLFGRHPDKMGLVGGDLAGRRPAGDAAAAECAGSFDLVVEATGASGSIRNAVALTRPMGTLVLKSTVSLSDPSVPGWAELANAIVVNELTLCGSRCGPLDVALAMMEQHGEVRALCEAMVTAQYPLAQAEEALEHARRKGVLKVQVVP